MDTKDGVRRTWLAWALLLPAAALAWPWPEPILARDLIPQATGIGVAALCALPAALLGALIARPTTLRGTLVFSTWLAAVGAWTVSGECLDTFEGARAVLFACTSFALLVAGAQLDERGRQVFTRGATAISIVWLVHAHLDGAHDLAGALGNTGHLAEAAGIGALAGAASWASASRAWRAAGALAVALAVALAATYALRVPVLTGVVALAAPLALAALVARAAPRTARIAWASVAALVLCAAAFTLLRPSAPAPAEGAAAAEGPAPSDAAGLEVRLRIWRASAALFADHPWAGVGPGQFAAAFPPYRDPEEIALSTHGHALSLETEVEHAHSDWLTPVLETGVLAGLAWIALLALVARAALRALRANENVHLAIAALGVLVSALAGAPLSFDAASMCLAFPLFGALLADTRPAASHRPLARRMRALLALALLCACVPRALAFVRHGVRLRELASDPPGRLTEGPHLREALNACRDSVLARTLAVRAARTRGATREELETQWQAILDLRPQRVEAWIELGFLAAIDGDPDTARPRFEHALALDPENPTTLQNLTSLEIESGAVEKGLAYFERLQAVRPLPKGWLEQLGARLWLRGNDDAAEKLFARVRPELAGLTPELAYATGREMKKTAPGVLADALESVANRKWAVEHAEAGRFDMAVRSFRAALSPVRHYGVRAPLLQLQYAAALALTDRADEARAAIGDVTIDSVTISVLPEWARASVAELGRR